MGKCKLDKYISKAHFVNRIDFFVNSLDIYYLNSDVFLKKIV